MDKFKALIAHEDDVFRAGIEAALKQKPEFQIVDTCDTGFEAVEKASDCRPDVVLIDDRLRNCDYLEAIRQIRQRLPEGIVIVLATTEETSESFCSPVGDYWSTLMAGAKGFIQKKDIKVEDLTGIITLLARSDVHVFCYRLTEEVVEDLVTLWRYLYSLDSGPATPLTKREKIVLLLIAMGLTNRQIAQRLEVSENTAKMHVRNIMEKLHAHTRQEASALAVAKRNIKLFD